MNPLCQGVARMLSVIVLLCASGVMPQSAAAGDVPRFGRVVAVLDGDTLQVDLPGRGLVNVHLAWVDAPDRVQDSGEAARSSLSAMAFGQEVRLENASEGAGGALVAIVWAGGPSSGCSGVDCPKTLDLGMAQLARGMAWHDRRALGQPPQSIGQYERAEFEAKSRRLGLWAARNPVPPWLWRPR